MVDVKTDGERGLGEKRDVKCHLEMPKERPWRDTSPACLKNIASRFDDSHKIPWSAASTQRTCIVDPEYVVLTMEKTRLFNRDIQEMELEVVDIEGKPFNRGTCCVHISSRPSGVPE
jgi:hypothetical protein